MKNNNDKGSISRVLIFCKNCMGLNFTHVGKKTNVKIYIFHKKAINNFKKILYLHLETEKVFGLLFLTPILDLIVIFE